MIKKIILMIFLLVFYASNFKIVLAQEVPVLKDVQVEAKVSFDSDIQMFTYTYIVINPSTNTGQIYSVEIDISKPESGKNLSTEGLTISHGINPRGIELIRSFTEEISRFGSLLEVQVIPVGTKPPSNWRSAITVERTISWGSKGEYDIMPGKSLSGFEILSRGLPTIRTVKVEPWWIQTVEGYVTEEDIKRGNEIEEQISFSGKTLGPTAPPADFKSIEFIDYIINMKHEAFSLGWIKNKGIENSLDVKLENAKKKLQASDIKTAKNILNAFINEVEAQKDKHLTTEAYGLLKYNAEYLIGRL